MRFLLTVANVGLAIGSIQAQPVMARTADVPPIIRSFAQFMRAGRVAGTRRIEIGQGAKPITEFIVKNGEHMRTTYPQNSPMFGQVIVESRNIRKHYDPVRNEVVVTELHPASQDERILNFVRRRVKFEVADGGKVAGQATTAVTFFNPRGLMQVKLWLDTQTGFPLKKVTYNAAGHVQASFEFESVNYETRRPRPADFELNVPNAKTINPLDVSRRIAEAIGLTPIFLPKPQFFLQSSQKHESRFGDFLVQVYEGEIGRVTLFQSGRLIRFQPPASGQALVWQQNGQTYALLGQAPGVLQRLARLLGKPD